MSENTKISLLSYAKPLYEILDDSDINELSYNGDGDIAFIESKGVWRQINLRKKFPNFENWLQNFSRMVASYNQQGVDNKNPLLSGTLPGGERIQIIAPPCANYAFSIRKPTKVQFTLDDYRDNGSFSRAKISSDSNEDPEDLKLKALYEKKDFYNFIKNAVLFRKNIIVSGGTSTGKTTFFNAIADHIPKEERLISIEDSREIVLSQPNKLHLIAPRNNESVTFVTLLEACLRLRPDRIMAAELRGAEAFAYLRAINTGHPGSITTVHANNPKACFQQLYMMLAQAQLGLDKNAVEDYVKNVIDIVIQLKNSNGERYISEIWYRG